MSLFTSHSCEAIPGTLYASALCPFGVPIAASTPEVASPTFNWHHATKGSVGAAVGAAVTVDADVAGAEVDARAVVRLASGEGEPHAEIPIAAATLTATVMSFTVFVCGYVPRVRSRCLSSSTLYMQH